MLGIPCHMISKATNTSRDHNRAKQTHVNSVDPATHLKNAQHMGRDAWDLARWIPIEWYAEE